MRRITALGTTLLVLASVACIRPGGPGDIRRELTERTGLEVKKEFGITVTRSAIKIAAWGMRKFGDEEIPPVKGISKVQVGVYEVRGIKDGYETIGRVRPSDLVGEDWETVVRIHDDGEDVFVLTRVNEKGHIRQMLVVVMEQDEWVLVRIKGKLDKTIEHAMQYAMDEVGRPELFARMERQRDRNRTLEAGYVDDGDQCRLDVTDRLAVCLIDPEIEIEPIPGIEPEIDPDPAAELDEIAMRIADAA